MDDNLNKELVAMAMTLIKIRYDKVDGTVVISPYHPAKQAQTNKKDSFILENRINSLTGQWFVGKKTIDPLKSTSDLSINTKRSLFKENIPQNLSDAIRSHAKFKMMTEKYIDTSISSWLSHAPFRLVK
ncbi:Hypothetical protein CINCED_3A017325 [Cinara cedri]|uniref:Uncharacterized protein n=1 Tax=Cinara cedri TaxID=506608 RepID=A0A5E4MC96_9HEMI|nr:Hypothetical protein CINCED_3A017325 [Cinara cedri]